MDHEEVAAREMERIKLEEEQGANGAHAQPLLHAEIKGQIKHEDGSQSPSTMPDGLTPRGDGEDTPTSGKGLKLSRKSSSKTPTRTAPLYDNLPNVTSKACEAFQVIPDCLYGSKNLGSTDNDSFDCECREEWHDGENLACGEYSDCINRATKMECTADAGTCGGSCQNQRFQRKEYANVSVIDTEKKGFGLRTDTDLQANDFIFEYIGEVINEPTFRRRMLQYDQEGIKHFYFMSLSKSEFVDATRKGNLGRFCNHSCNPNCYVDKWVVGDKLRMGIFALRKVLAGEELVFNYNVDRYGADPQPCYCGEPNCVGFIGGKTQTERATKLPAATVEALGIDAGDGWDTSVAKKPRKKRADEDDEDYVNSIQPRSLDEEDARKVMAALVQCKEKWIAVKLLERIQRCEEERVIHCVIRMHAYQILKTTLNTFHDDTNVVLQVLSILDKFPRLTRNKISDSKIEAAVENCAHSEHEEVAAKSKKLLDEWSKLEVAYRIRRRAYDPNAQQSGFDERRGGHAREEATPKAASPKPIDAPKGPRNNVPQRLNGPQFNGPRPPRRTFGPLPPGWFHAKDARGQSYFYDKQGNTTWQRPTKPAADANQKTAAKAAQEQLQIQNIINRVTKEGTPKQASQTPVRSSTPTKEPQQEKWRSLPVEKQMKIYENTVFPHVKHVLDKFRHKLPREDLKRLGKEVAKKLVASDYKNNRVNDPGEALTSKQSKKIRSYVHDFLQRAVQKYEARQKDKTAGNQPTQSSGTPSGLVTDVTKSPTESTTPKDEPMRQDAPVLSDGEDVLSPGSADRKRKRDGDQPESAVATPSDGGPEVKRLKEDEAGALGAATPPPPPPPPPESGAPPSEADDEQRRALQEQEEALMRENEEAQRLEDEATKTNQREVAADEMQREIDVMKSGNKELLSH
ncbi:SRI (Set2 rpb1 interacting) domain-containing protein [Sarocladium implicatum]|nr:SRI (Set2 rpb1 interacting) domain-containing protein [Sarocladium implicatum]